MNIHWLLPVSHCSYSFTYTNPFNFDENYTREYYWPNLHLKKLAKKKKKRLTDTKEGKSKLLALASKL